ncbi:MAG: hypothetical protein HKO95_09670 [Rhodobacteraceae bacterium]|jgi:Rod binding domain-containing protein|nr:rod-binding protein [Alphaproteobacteria bacterium]MBT8476624.1 rod-binding protein [Alphaproteobacteria bacterium]NNK66993.1 hypothetical protein [Paracoccaceae bacterium]
MIDATGPRIAAPQTGRDPALWKAAQKIEGAFLSEMLKSAGFGEARQSFGGGPGEAQFASFLRDTQVAGMVEAGGIGLAENIYRSLLVSTDAG